MPDYLFAYGTLQPGAAPAEIAGVAARLIVIGEGQVRGRLYDLGHFPGAVLETAGNERGDHRRRNDDNETGQHIDVICGTVFELPGDLPGEAEILRALDAYEEFDPGNPAASQFLRRRCVVTLATGRAAGTAIDCWIYVYNRGIENRPVVEGGRWNRGTVSASG